MVYPNKLLVHNHVRAYLYEIVAEAEFKDYSQYLIIGSYTFMR